MVYLDWASTAPPDREILDKAREIELRYYANPSSIHTAGRECRGLLEESRGRWAKALGCLPKNIIFTSGGTESNNLVLQRLIFKKGRPSIVLSGIEHPSLYEPAQKYRQLGIDVRIVKPESTGHIRPDKFADSVDETTVFAALMTVNNVTGAVQPVQETVSLVREKEKLFGKKIHFHSDAVQAVGKIPFFTRNMDVDSASFSAHKFGAPKGIGVLYLKNTIQTLTAGGDQEFGMRPGTENLSSIYASSLGVLKAVQNQEQNYPCAKSLMEKILKGIEKSSFLRPLYRRVDSRYTPYIISIAAPPVPGEVLVRSLNDAGILIGSGSACSQVKAKKSRVFDMMGTARSEIDCMVRVSIGPETAEEDIESFLDSIETVVSPLHSTLTR